MRKLLSIVGLLLAGTVFVSAQEVSLRDAVSQRPPHERANFKADEIIKDAKTGTYSGKGFSVTLHSVRKIEGGVEAYVSATKAGKPVGFGDGTVEIEHFRFFNPPLMVEDSLGIFAREFRDPRGNLLSVKHYREDPNAALREIVADTVRIVGQDGKNVVRGKVGSTTDIFYPNGNPETESVDGYIASPGSTWPAIHDLLVGDSASDSTADLYTEASYLSPNFYINRSIVTFYTEPLPDSEITSAKISLWPTTVIDDDADGQDYISIVTSTGASATAVTVNDFGSLGTVKQSADVSLNGLATGAYVDWTFNATGISNISKTGLSRFGYIEGHDLENIPITGGTNKQNALYVSAADLAGTTQDPKLTVTYTGGTSSVGGIIIIQSLSRLLAAL